MSSEAVKGAHPPGDVGEVVAWFVRRETSDGRPFSSSLRFYKEDGPDTVSEPLIRQSEAATLILSLQARIEALEGGKP